MPMVLWLPVSNRAASGFKFDRAAVKLQRVCDTVPAWATNLNLVQARLSDVQQSRRFGSQQPFSTVSDQKINARVFDVDRQYAKSLDGVDQQHGFMSPGDFVQAVEVNSFSCCIVDPATGDKTSFLVACFLDGDNKSLRLVV